MNCTSMTAHATVAKTTNRALTPKMAQSAIASRSNIAMPATSNKASSAAGFALFFLPFNLPRAAGKAMSVRPNDSRNDSALPAWLRAGFLTVGEP